MIGAFSTFTFKVIIDKYVLIAILLIVVWVFFVVFLVSSSFALFLCDLMTIFSVMFGFLSLFVCVSLIGFWFVVTMRIIYNILYMCVCVCVCVCV